MGIQHSIAIRDVLRTETSDHNSASDSNAKPRPILRHHIGSRVLGLDEAQEPPVPRLSPGSARKTHPSLPANTQLPPESIILSVPKGTPLQVAVAQEIRVSREGQPVHARIVEPVYAFDRLVIPVGSKVEGKISKIDKISGGKRTLAALNADFTPARNVQVEFSELELPDGRHFQLQTSVAAGAGELIRLTAAESKEQTGARNAVSEKTRQVREEAKKAWTNAMAQLKTPGRGRRLERYIEAQLPVHAQYIPVGTVYFAELNSALDFGTEPNISADDFIGRRSVAVG